MIGTPPSMTRPMTFAGCVLLAAAGAHAQDPQRGQLLYENHCRECHEDGVHFRQNRKATDSDELTAFVVQWVRELQLNWTADEVADARSYLNARFYQFEK